MCPDVVIIPFYHREVILNLIQDKIGYMPYLREMESGMVFDNTLLKTSEESHPHTGAHLTAIFDSCHSDTLLDLDSYLRGNSIHNPWKLQGPAQRVHRKNEQRECHMAYS